MTAINKVIVKKEIYIWAIEESQKSFEEIKSKFNKIDEWISQDDSPTFRQLEGLSNFLKVPLGYMFLHEPPKTSIIESEFRTIGNKLPRISKNLIDTLTNMSRKKDWLSEYRKEKGWEKIVPDSFKNLDKEDSISISKMAKDYLGLSEYWYEEFKDTRLAFNHLKEVLEYKGIIIMQNGIVGTNTRRNLDINEFRGFLLYDDLAPLIFINAKDSLNGKIFTLIHEYIHLLLQQDDVFIEEFREHEDIDEKSINNITAEFLIPTSHIKDLWNYNSDEFEQIDYIGKLFHVSKLALAIKLREMGVIKQHTVDMIKQNMEAELDYKRSKTGGGNFYNNSKSRYSDNFAKSVVQGAESGYMSYTHAFDLFDGSSKIYDYFKEETMTYGE